MKYFAALVAVAVAVVVGLAGCGSGVKLPPVSPDDVQVFMPGTFPSDEYKVLSKIQEAYSLDTSDSELIDRAKARAAELGADAILIDSIRLTSEGGIEMDLNQQQQKILEARAVYYPSKHPELSSGESNK